jgi:hypothetical protein
MHSEQEPQFMENGQPLITGNLETEILFWQSQASRLAGVISSRLPAPEFRTRARLELARTQERLKAKISEKRRIEQGLL